MRSIISEFEGHPLLRAVAIRILRLYGVPGRDQWSTARAFLAWVQSEIVYVPERRDLWFSPLRTIWLGGGDCDDQAILLASLASQVKIPTRLIALRRNGRAFHVFVEMSLPDRAFGGRRWIPAETTIPAHLGWDPRKATPAELRKFRG